MAEQWLSIVEYARRYKISDMTIRRRIKTGKLQAVLQEGKYFIPMSGIDKPQQEPSRDPSLEFSQDFSREPQNLQRPRPGQGVEGEPYQSRPHPSPQHPLIYQQAPTPLVKSHPQPGPSMVPDVNNQQSLGGSYQSRGPQQNHVEHSGPYHQAPQRVYNGQLPRGSYSQDSGYGVESPNPNIQMGVHSKDQSILPDNLWRPLAGTTTAIVDTKALLAYCDATVRKAIDLERKTIDRFKSKLETLEATIVAKDLEIKSLRQQIEDMQLLVKIIERRK